MKKFYAFVAAALMSASMFAAAPTAAVLAQEYDVVNNVVLCINPIEDAELCNDIRFVGTPNNWGKGDVEGASEAFDNCEKFMPVPGYDGWYAAELPYSAGFEGKPVQEPTDRVWSWDYQCGDVDAWVHVDGETMNIVAGFTDECNISMSAPGAYIYQLKYWKAHKSPCKPVVKHTYTVKVYAPDACPDMKPALAGDALGWTSNPMNEELDEEFNTVYTISFVDQEGHAFKIKELTDTDWSNQMQYYDETEDSWFTFANIELGPDSVIVLDWSDNTKYRFAQCDGEEPVEVYVFLIAPAGAPAAGVEIIGSFDGWSGTKMTYSEQYKNYWAVVEAKGSDEFKFREAGDTEWTNQIMQWIPANDANPDGKWDGLPNLKFADFWEIDEEEDMVAWVDLSDPAQYCWTVPQGIENVVLTEQAQKVVVDGVIYIIRNNKMFNLQGAQVR